MSADSAPARLSELIAALSLATDLGMGQPMEQALNTCLLSVKAGRALGASEAALSEIYYLALLRFVGCPADAHEAAIEVGGDEIGFRGGLAPLIMAEMPEMMMHLLRHLGEGLPLPTRVRLFAGEMVAGTKSARKSIAEHCEIAQMLAGRVGFSQSVARDVGSTFERWDGKGIPGALAGEAIPLACRVVLVARDVDIFNRIGGFPIVAEVLRKRRGKAYDPSVADAFLSEGEAWLEEMEQQPAWEAVIAAEPGVPAVIEQSNLDDVLSAFADLADLKSPHTAGHSSEVAELANGAAQSLGLSRDEVTQVRRAAMLHDLGKTGIPNGIWDKAGPLSNAEWERVRLHPYLTERILSYCPPLKPLAALAGSHHERLDGRGYHRGAEGASLSTGARLLAAADAYQAMSQPRSYRAALGPMERERELSQQVADGRLDQGAVRAVLECAGHAMRSTRHAWPDGLTDREVEVLRLMIRGYSNRLIANELVLSPKTVGRHIENIYGKIGVSSRATAAMYAMEHRLVTMAT